jgi:NitT/TauT family transport system substrate-binding protein
MRLMSVNSQIFGFHTASRKFSYRFSQLIRGIPFFVIVCLALSATTMRAGETLHIGIFPNVTHAQGLVAANMSRQGKGWFESRLGEPIKIEWMIYNAGSSAMEGIFTGALDMTFVGPSPAINGYARANGKDVRVLSGAMRGGEALVVRGNDIHTPEDLRGKSIATPQLGNTQDVQCRSWLLDHGIKVTLIGGQARVIPTANPDILALIQQGRLDAAWTVEPWVTRLINEGGCQIFHSDPNALTTILIGRVAFLNEKPVLAKKFVQALDELTDWIKANPEEAKRRIRDELSAITKKEIKQALINEAWTRLVFENTISVDPFESFIAKARQVGFLRASINLEHLIWNP